MGDRKRKVAIVGTAGTWHETPWEDPDMDIWTLNDAYVLGFKRIDAHFETHRLDSFIFRKKDSREPITAAMIPPGHYLRPEGHVEWLQEQSHKIDIYLQEEPQGDVWGPGAKRFPRERLVEKYREILFVDPTWTKEYIRSGPSWMLLLAMDMGYEEIHSYGIHLATEREYVEQRPNFEALLAYAIGKGIKVVLPKGTPIFKGNYVYCYERRLSQEKDAIKYKLSDVQARRNKLAQQYQRQWLGRKALKHELDELGVEDADLRQQLLRIDFQDALSSPEWRVM